MLVDFCKLCERIKEYKIKITVTKNKLVHQLGNCM